MRQKIFIFDSQRLNLDCMKLFLEKDHLTKGYEILCYTHFEDLEKNNDLRDSILVLNFLTSNTQEISHVIEKFLDSNPTLKILVHSTNPDVKTIKKLFDKGIKSYLGSNSTTEEFLEALNHLSRGKIFVPDHIKNSLIDCLCQSESQHNDRNHNVSEDITTREKDVLQLICEGLRSREIADKLFISAHTVETHRRNIMLKFNINKSSALVKFAIENHLVQ